MTSGSKQLLIEATMYVSVREKTAQMMQLKGTILATFEQQLTAIAIPRLIPKQVQKSHRLSRINLGIPVECYKDYDKLTRNQKSDKSECKHDCQLNRKQRIHLNYESLFIALAFQSWHTIQALFISLLLFLGFLVLNLSQNFRWHFHRVLILLRIIISLLIVVLVCCLIRILMSRLIHASELVKHRKGYP